MNCYNCGMELTAAEKFCSSCGNPTDQQPSKDIFCPGCGTKAEAGSAFCYSCGYNFSEPSKVDRNDAHQKHQFTSTIRQSSGKKQLRNIAIIALAIILTITIAIIIWIKVDPQAKEKLTNIGYGILLIAGFIWYLKSKKKSGKGGGSSFWDQENNHEDYDDNDDDGDDDD
ncbi:double zinc ribbon domain-containing protein [Sunxiuqinia sp. A32]|uniref:double zinc ribbon domain-containing protein n=1 Tax=Sunxiuqinia sp. A32 TaxID=3461496 RepID=UPI004045A7B1